MNKVFIYWDNSNIFHAAQELAEERNGGFDPRRRVRIDFEKMFRLAHADRPIAKAVVAGSVPPALQELWNQLSGQGIAVKLFKRGEVERGEQNMPDYWLQLQMARDVLANDGDPGIVVLLSGDGAGYLEGDGFHRVLEQMHAKGWRIELLSWMHSCNSNMRQWVEKHGAFVPLDKFYEAVTSLKYGFDVDSSPGRSSVPLDLSKRPTV